MEDGSDLPDCVSYIIEQGQLVFTIVAAKNENTVGSYPIVVKAIATLGAATTTKSVSFTLDVLKFTSEDSPYTITNPPKT